MAQQLEMLKQQEVLRLHDHLTRDMLLFAERKRWIAPDTDLPRGSKMKTRRYDDKQLRIIHYLNEAYKRGYSVEQIESVLADLSILANVDVSLLSRASSELINAVQLCDDKALIALVAQWGCRLLDAECCLIFLEPETLPGRLRLAAGTRYEKTTERFTKPQIRQTRYAKSLINGHPPFDMLDEINSRAGASPINAIVNLFHSDLADYKPSHLSTGCHSWMSIPLLDRKQRLFGYLVVENRFGKGSRPTPVVFFDEAIQRIGESYAIVLGALLNLYPTVIAQKRLLNPPKDKIPKTVFREALRIALLINRGYRAEAALYSDNVDDLDEARLSVIARRGKSTVTTSNIPKRSICYQVFNWNKPWNVSDVKARDYLTVYHESSEFSRSQLTVPIRHPFNGKAIGVLSVESHLLNWFDEQDCTSLQTIADQIGIFATSIAAETKVLRLLHSSLPGVSPLQRVLDLVISETRFSGGLIFLADYALGQLEVRAHTESVPKFIIKDLARPFGEKSFAIQVFSRGESLFSALPKDDTNVDLKAYGRIGASGALLGLPIKFGDIVVGAMILWSENDNQPQVGDIERLTPFVNLLVSSENVLTSKNLSEDLYSDFHAIHDGVLRDDPLESTLNGCVKALCRVAERARIMELLDNNQSLGCRASAGVANETLNMFKSESPLLVAEKSRHLKRLMLMEKAPNSNSVYINPKVDGVDEFAHHWNRPDDLEFYNQVVYLKGKMWGYIAIDNNYTKSPIKSKFTEEMLERVALLLELALNRDALS